MKKLFLFTLMMIFSSQLFAQEATQQVNKSKSNVKNNFEVEGKLQNDSQKQIGMKASKTTIHIDTDESGNDLVFIPTNQKPTVLVLDSQTQTFRVAGKVKGKITTAGDIGKRMHKPYSITMELDKKFKRTTDENGDIDISDLRTGIYNLKKVEKDSAIPSQTIVITIECKGDNLSDFKCIITVSW